jgi:sugar (pentulose or hexulose) kinase
MASSLVPSPSSLFLGVDIGTSGVRAMLIDDAAEVVAGARAPLPPPDRDGPRSEQDPQLWWQALATVLDELGPGQLGRVRALALDGTSGTVLLADADGLPLHPALLYNDRRARDEAASLADIAPATAPVHAPTAGLPKLLWLARQPFAKRARHCLHQADWLAGRLRGRFGDSDANNALKTGYDPVARRWPDWLQKLPLPGGWLPEVRNAGEPIGPLDPAMARRFGFASDTLLLAGTTDSTAAFIATGAARPGEAVTCLGSTLVLKVVSDEPVTAPRYGIYSQPLRDIWLAGGASSSGGAVLGEFFTDARLTELEPQLQPEAPTGLDYYPLPGPGERFPVADPDRAPRLDPRPADDAEFLQGLLEGIARIERLGYERLHQCGAPWPSAIRSTGRGARNAAWTRIRARVLGIPFVAPDHTEAACGAARLARDGYHRHQSR